MKKTISTVIATALLSAASLASAAQCGLNATGEYAVRIKVDTIGAINLETIKTVKDLLADDTLDQLKAKNSPELAKLYADHLVETVKAGRVVCVEGNTGFFQYAKRARLDPEGFTVWLRERDFAAIN